MASPFDILTLDQIHAQLKAGTPEWVSINVRYADGDHWQEGMQWVGPTPEPGSPDAQRVIAEIARAFTSQNAIGEVVERHVGGVIGNEPAWGFTVRRPLKQGKAPTRAEQTLIDEAEAALTTWWDARKVLGTLQALAATLLLTGRAPLRLYVPSGLRVVDPVLQTPVIKTASTLEQALDVLYLDRPQLAAAGVLTDPLTQQQCGVYVYQTGGTRLFDPGGETVAELSYVDRDTAETVLRIVRSGEANNPAERWTWPLSGHLLIGQAERSVLITDPIRRLQNQLNLSRTMSGRNIVQGGFLERLILNGQMPGEYVDDPTAPAAPDGTRKRFRPKPLRVGAGKTTFISGQAIRDKTGQITGYTPASVVYRDPVPTTTFREAADDTYRAILGEARQLHALISGDSTASGASRVQARADFAKSLGPTKAQLDALGRWLVETVLSMASVFAGQPGRFDTLRATFDCRIDTGPLSADERRAIVEEVEKGVLSLETALAMLGHDDVAAELARIAAEKAERQAEAQKAAPADPSTDPAAQGQGAQNAQGNNPPTDSQRPPAQGAAAS